MCKAFPTMDLINAVLFQEITNLIKHAVSVQLNLFIDSMSAEFLHDELGGKFCRVCMVDDD